METEEQSLERQKNERDVLEALTHTLDDYKCDVTEISVENVYVVVNIRTLKGRFITQVLYLVVRGGVKCEKEEKC